MNIVQTIKDWCHHRYLKKHGCRTQEEYDLKYDPDYNFRGHRIKKEVYHGYSVVIPFYPARTTLNNTLHILDQSLEHEIKQWCKDNCRDKFRYAWHRVLEDYWNTGEYEENGIAGSDILFFAFKDRRDATMFILKWMS